MAPARSSAPSPPIDAAVLRNLLRANGETPNVGSQVPPAAEREIAAVEKRRGPSCLSAAAAILRFMSGGNELYHWECGTGAYITIVEAL